MLVSTPVRRDLAKEETVERIDRDGQESLEWREVKEESALSLAWRAFRRHRPALAGTAIVALFILAAIFADYLAPYSPYEADYTQVLAPPSRAHPLGTEDIGRDALTRLLYGGRISLFVGLVSMLVALVIGTTVGAIAGYFGGVVDNALMRLVDMALCFPRLFLLILISAFVGTNLPMIIFVIGALSWMQLARLVRACFLSIKEMDFTLAARCIGASPLRIMLRHILPNALSPILVNATLVVASAILAESSLSFLGMGVQPPTSTWGNMLRLAQDVIFTAPWLSFAPGLAIFLTVLSINYIGDGLRDALDPFKVQ